MVADSVLLAVFAFVVFVVDRPTVAADIPFVVWEVAFVDDETLNVVEVDATVVVDVVVDADGLTTITK